MTLALGMIVALWSVGPLSGAVAQVAPSITSAPPPNGTVGNGYLHQFTASPQTPEPTFSVTSGTLPPGVTLTPQGFLSGTPTAAGTYGPTTVCASNGATAPACQTFTITIARRSPNLLAAPSPGGPVGTPVRETVSVVGGYLPTGSVTFRLFSDPTCTTEVFSSTNVLTVEGTATSSDFTPPNPGTYYWRARYSGDANNNPVETACDPSNSVTITGSGTTTTTTTTTTTVPTTTTTTTVPTSTTATSVPTSTSTSTSTSTTSTSSTSTTVPTGTTSSSTSSTVATTSTTTPSTTSTVPATTSTVPATTSTVPATTSTTAATTTSTTSPTATTTTTTSPATTTTAVPATTTTAAPATTTTEVPGTTTTTTTAAATTTTIAGAAAQTTTSTTAPPTPTVQVTPQQVAPGDTLTVSGSGYPPDSPVQAELFSDPVVLGSTTTDAGGSFRMTVTVPGDTAPGFHILRVSVVGGTVAAETTIFVSARARAQGADGGLVTAAVLSRTGSDVAGPARLALGLVVAGFVLVGLAWKEPGPVGPAVGRRRRSPWD